MIRLNTRIIFFLLAALLSSQRLDASTISVSDWTKIKMAVADDIDALVSDTVNEGENQAFVLRKGRQKTPVMVCRNKSIPTRHLEILLCTVTFRVKPYQASWTQRTCDLTYLLDTDKPFPSINRGLDSIFDACLEALSEGE